MPTHILPPAVPMSAPGITLAQRYHNIAGAYAASILGHSVASQTTRNRLTRLDLLLHLAKLPGADRHALAAGLLRSGLSYKSVANLLRFSRRSA